MAEQGPVRDDSHPALTSAVLDEAHVGDIHGAFGTIRLGDLTPRRTWRRRLLTLAAIIGPGLLVVGEAKLISERFGRFWGWFSVGDLFLLNFLTISTEFIGVSLAGACFGLSPYIVVPVAALILIGITVTGNFRRWERAMFVFLFASLLVLPLVFLSHPAPGAALHGLVGPSIQGGFSSNAVLLIIAIVGTTVAPWQLFFQQSN